MEKFWLRTDAQKEAYKSLEKLDETISLIKEDVYQWKWVIIVIQNCLQAFMTLALLGTYRIGVVRTEQTNKVLLIDFRKLYRRIQKKNYMTQNINSQVFISNEKYNKAIKDLINFRNDFIHYVPKSWSIQLRYFPKQFLYLVEILEFLIFSSGNIEYRYSDIECGDMKLRIQRIKDNLKGLKYEQ